MTIVYVITINQVCRYAFKTCDKATHINLYLKHISKLHSWSNRISVWKWKTLFYYSLFPWQCVNVIFDINNLKWLQTETYVSEHVYNNLLIVIAWLGLSTVRSESASESDLHEEILINSFLSVAVIQIVQMRY